MIDPCRKALLVLTAIIVSVHTCNASTLQHASTTSSNVYVAPNGNDRNPGTSPDEPVQTLPRARDIARTMLSQGIETDLYINLAAGSYTLNETLTLDSRDSGKADGKRVIWRADAIDTVFVSGGAIISSFQSVQEPAPFSRVRHDAAVLDQYECPNASQPQVDCGFYLSSEQECLQRGCCWTPGGLKPSGHFCNAPVGPTRPLLRADIKDLAQAQSRHLYVNGRRALRSRLYNSEDLFQNAKLTADGILVQDTSALAWRPGVEFAWPQSTSPWTEPRCVVDNVTRTDGGIMIYMKQPCWQNILNKPCGQVAKGPPDYVENVIGNGSDFGLLPGAWYRDETNQQVLYVLREGESVNASSVVMPILEQLIVGTNLEFVSFVNITFQHTTWKRPSLGDGYVEQQSGSGITGTDPRNYVCNDDFMWRKSPGNVAFHGSNSIEFKRCHFRHHGAVALDFGDGSHNNVVDTCFFEDISGAAVQIGSFYTYNETDPSMQEINNTIRNTVVRNAGVEFRGAVGINLGYTKFSTITKCDVGNFTYGAISMGWGWSRHPITYAANNTISYNKVHDYKTMLNDGGGIYTLGPQNGTQVFRNWVYNQGTASSGALYPDEGSAYMVWHHNVVTNIGSSQWLHLWTSSIHNITVEDNFSDTSTYLNHGTNCPMINNTVFTPGKPPAAAQQIMQEAGPVGFPWHYD